MIDDADDAGIDRRLDRMEGKAGFLAAHEEHMLAGSGAHRIDGHDRLAHRLAIGRQGLDDEQLDADEVLVLASGHDFADDLGQLHD